LRGENHYPWAGGPIEGHGRHYPLQKPPLRPSRQTLSGMCPPSPPSYPFLPPWGGPAPKSLFALHFTDCRFLSGKFFSSNLASPHVFLLFFVFDEPVDHRQSPVLAGGFSWTFFPHVGPCARKSFTLTLPSAIRCPHDVIPPSSAHFFAFPLALGLRIVPPSKGRPTRLRCC